MYYDVILQRSGSQLIQVIKQIRYCNGMGLKEAKDLATSAPGVIKAGVSRRAAEDIRQAFVQVGAEVALVPSRSKQAGRQRRQEILRRVRGTT